MKENLIVKMIFGSHLYGTATEDSDRDYKGVYLPSKEEIFLNRISKSYRYDSKTSSSSAKNSSTDTDIEIYSLHYFIRLALEGQTVALDMLHAPADMLAVTSPIWERIVANRSKFYTKNLNAFVGYARQQAAKYGVKGSRLDAAKKVIDFLNKEDPKARLSTVWNRLPTGEHIYFFETNDNIKQYQVCGRNLQETIRVDYALDIVNTFYNAYGERAKAAMENKFVDWKAISHAFRAAFQVKQLLTEGTIVFPLKEAPFLTDVKRGKLDYSTEAAPQLEHLMDEIELLAGHSDLPKEPDVKFWEQFIIDIIDEYVL